MRSEIVASWRRSLLCGAQPDGQDATYVGESTDTALLSAARRILERLPDRLSGTNTAVLLADRDGVIQRRWVGEASLAAAMDRSNSAPGFALGEDVVGTNGLGSVLEEEHAYFVIGAEHIASRFTDYGCYGAPIRNRVNGRIEGVLTLLCRASEANPLMLGFTEEAAAAIEDQLLARSSARHRRLMDSFLAANRHANQPVAAINEETLLFSAAASRLFDDADQAAARDIAMRAYRGEEMLTEPLALGPERIVVVRATPVFDGRKAVGALLDFEAAAPPCQSPSPAMQRPTGADHALAALGGTSAPWVAAVEKSARALAAAQPLLLIGESGVGKRELARTVLGPQEATVLDAALLLPAGVPPWLTELDAALAESRPILLAHLEALEPSVASAVAARLSAYPEASALVATYTLATGALPPAGTVLDALAPRRVTVPPLRERSTDIPELAQRLAKPRVVSAGAIQRLVSAPWPGNVSELRRVLSRSVAADGRARIEASDLPDELRPAARTHGMIEQAELQAIEAALLATNGDKRDAAQRLGISLATLYRRIKAMRIEI